MKIIILCLTMLCSSVCMASDALSTVDLLIAATSKSLEAQKNLRHLIISYNAAHEAYSQNPQDDEYLLSLIKAAYLTLNCIEENHLTDSFDPKFMSELQMLSKTAKKQKVPRPSEKES